MRMAVVVMKVRMRTMKIDLEACIGIGSVRVVLTFMRVYMKARIIKLPE